VERHREFDDTEAGTEVTAGDRDDANRLLPKLVRQLHQLIFGQPAEVARIIDAIE
jgi:hypothetical protein